MISWYFFDNQITNYQTVQTLDTLDRRQQIQQYLLTIFSIPIFYLPTYLSVLLFSICAILKSKINMFWSCANLNPIVYWRRIKGLIMLFTRLPEIASVISHLWLMHMFPGIISLWTQVQNKLGKITFWFQCSFTNRTITR